MDTNPSDDETNDDPTEATAHSGTVLLLLAGGSLAIAGIALELVPEFAHDYTWIVNGFAKHGITGMPLALCGLIFLGLCVVSRARDKADQRTAELRRREREAKEGASDQTLLLEQLASDLALTRGGMQELRVEFVYLKDMVQSAQKQAVDPTTGLDEAQAAIFRLAASMDQLGGRIEQRLKSQDAVFHEVVAALRAEIAMTNSSLSELRLRIEQGIQDATSSSLGRTVEGGVDEVDFSEVGEDYEIDLATGYEAHPDDLHVEVELEQPASNGLGLLDDLDDQGKPRRSKTSPSIRPSIPRTNTYADLGLEERPVEKGSVAGALPHRLTQEEEIEEKLAALRALMADPSVRRALEASRHRA
jgi:hypothetical protein